MTTTQDFTAGGTKIEGQYENDRNAESSDLIKAIVRKAFNVTDVIVAHHIVYVTSEVRDGFTYQIVEEIPSIDALIFDTEIAQKLWGKNWQENLQMLAVAHVSERDKLLASLWSNTYGNNQRTSIDNNLSSH